MSKGLIFWVLMLLWLVFGAIWNKDIPGGRLGIAGGLLTFILLFLLGWQVFGFIVQ